MLMLEKPLRAFRPLEEMAAVFRPEESPTIASAGVMNQAW